MSLNVDIYLRNAFRELDAFSLPSIGTFRKVHLSAEVDEYQREVYPPRIEIEFSNQVDTQVSLERYLIHQIQMPTVDATRIITNICEEITSSLATTGKFELSGLGTLVKEQKALSFQQAPDRWVSGEFFGLQPVTLTFAVADSHATQAEEEKVPMASTISSPSASSSPKRNWRLATSIIAAATVAIVAFFLRAQFALERSSFTPEWRSFATAKLDQEPLDDASTALLAEETATSENESASNTQKDAEQASNPGSNEIATDQLLATNDGPGSDTDIPDRFSDQQTRDAGLGTTRGQESLTPSGNLNELTNASPNARLATPQTSYFVILGVFRQQRSVNKFVQNLQQDGYTPKVINQRDENGNLNYKVAVFESGNRDEAEAFKRKMERLGFNSPWVFEFTAQ